MPNSPLPLTADEKAELGRPPLWFVFDVESIGLHGEAFAVGWVVLRDGIEVDSGRAECWRENARGADADRAWVDEHIPVGVRNCSTPAEVRALFWCAWRTWRDQGAVMAADCAWPVEARFLAACVDVDPDERRWLGPYPLHDVASVRLAAGLDPLATLDRLPSEEPKHCPLADARQSARLLMEALAHLARVEGERDEVRANYRFMVERAADQSLGGYRDLGDRAARAEEERDTARAESARLRDLVRHQRGPLHDAGLLTDEEYAALAGDHGAVARLEGYDEVRAEADRLTRELAEARDALNYLRRKLDEGDALREVADAAEGRATRALAGGGS